MVDIVRDTLGPGLEQTCFGEDCDAVTAQPPCPVGNALNVLRAAFEPPRECTADTLFDIASSAKCLTAASVGLLIDDNENYPEVQYNATMSSLLPDDFVMSSDDYTRSITVEDILSHRTGLAG